MWFGSRNGLNRFDGNSFKVFRNKLSDSASIGSNSIFSLFEDEKEILWVGTYKGIYLYNPIKESFRFLKLVPPGEVRFIKEDKAKNIWIICDFVLYKYNQLTSQLTSYPFEGEQTVALHISENGKIWIASNRGRVREYNASTDRFESYSIKELVGRQKIDPINTLYSVSDTLLLIGSTKKALLLNLRTLKVKNVFEGNKAIKDVHVHTIFQANANEFWFGTEAGLYIHNFKSGKTIIADKEYSNPYSVTDNIISAIEKDAEGGVWIGTYFGGVNYYSKQFNNFHKYFPEPGKNSLSGNLVHEICMDKYGRLWIGTEDAGLNFMDLKTGKIHSFLPDNKPGSISYRNIHGLVADGDELWIGTYEHGLDVMDLRTLKVVRHYNAAQNSSSFTSDFIVTLYRTRKGEILVGTWNGLFKYNRAKDNFSPFPFTNAHIQSIQEDTDGTLWVGTYGSGVYYINPETGQTGHVKYVPKSAGLLNNYVNSVYRDSRNNLWFGTEGGISVYSPLSREFTNYTVENGLPDNQVFKVLEDNSGMFWISTSKGLTRYDPKKQVFDVYSTPHGLPTEQFNYNSAFKSPDGSLFFGTVKGLVGFNPADFLKNTFVPPVYITGLQVNNKDVEIRGADSQLEKAIIYAESITLPYDQSNISLDVAALSYIMPEMNSYMYKMEGLDKTWTHLKNNRKIYYSKLPPGEYTFMVKGSNSEDIWNNSERTLKIIITPPFWATGIAYFFYLLFAASIVTIIFRYYSIALNEKNKRKIETLEINKEREIYNAKIEFFTNVAHEIRTPLTLIKMPLDKLLKKEDTDSDTEESLLMMKKNTNRLIDLTNQLLDFRKAEADRFSLNFSKTDINELLNEVHLLFKPAAEQKNLSCKIELPRITLHAYVDREALKKILTNLFNNAIKYADRHLYVKLLPFSSEDVSFHVEFRNDGNIIPLQLGEKIFEPFYRMPETAKEAGTGIGLPLARSLAELHRGSLELKQSDGTLNIFLLSLPIHQETEIHLGEYEQEEDPGQLETKESAEENVADHSKPAILLVEDNKEILGYLQRELVSGYHVLRAYNGQEALEILNRENVQLIISDIMMPVMDGIELCKKIKSDLQYSHIPIILLTAKNSVNSKIEGLEVGADAYIEKPFSFDHLLAQMNNLLTNRNIIKEYFARSPLTHIKRIAYSKADKNFLEQLNDVIYKNITDMDLDVDRLSSMMNMSRPTLYRKIKGLSNLTPNELINLTRLKKAAELLAEGDFKINEVATMVGYSLPTNFSRDFQRQFGVSPSNYLNKIKTDPSEDQLSL